MYGSFSAAQERIVNAGRCRAAEAAAAGCPVVTAAEDDTVPMGVDVAGAAEDCKDNDSNADEDGEGKLPWWDKVLPPYYPEIEDADPDQHLPPKDGSRVAWLHFYA